MTEGAFPMMTAEDMCAMVQRYVDSYNRGDVDAMLFNVHPDVEFTNIVNGKVAAAAAGIDELRHLTESSRIMFSERQQTVLAIDPGPDSVRLDFAFRGRSAQGLCMPARSEFHFRDGMIDRIVDIS